jgi:hypothetical protein
VNGEIKQIMAKIESIRKMRGFELMTDNKNRVKLGKVKKRVAWTERRIRSFRHQTGEVNW